MVQRIQPADWSRAIAKTDGPQMVVSGPGAGKTEFLVRRALHLIEQGVRPESLLLLSFSRRSASDLRRRIAAGIADSFTEVSSSTFHALAARLLEAYGPSVLGLNRVPALLTAPEHVDLVRRLLATEDPVRWPAAHRGMLGSDTFAADVAEFLQRCRELLVDAAALATRVGARPQWRGLDTFMTRYDAQLAEEGRIDYGTLQAKAIEVLADPRVVAELTVSHPYILVDEFQDTTRVQAEMLRLLYARHRNLTVTGDPYQTIYSFRGADASNLTDFPTAFPDAAGNPAAHLALTTSFRVRRDILRAAERVTAGGALPEVAGPVEPAPGPSSVEVYRFTQQSEEAEWIAGEAERMHLVDGTPYGAIAVLVRTKRRILNELSRALDRRGIPHDRPDVRSVDQPAVRVVLDLVIAASGPAPERGDALQRLLLGPLYSVTLGRWRELERAAARAGAGWAGVLRTEIPEAGDLADLIADPEWATAMSAADGFWHLWSHLDRFDIFAAADDDEARRALSSLSQVLSRLGERNSAASLADYVAMAESEDFEALPLLGFAPADGDRLALTTMHQAKGLEFDAVFIADATDGIIPDLRPRDSFLDTRLLDSRQPVDRADYALARLREEMRLAYTAMCRASGRVVWTTTAAGVAEDQGSPSRFLAQVAGVETLEEALASPTDGGAPVTPRAVVATLRRTLRDVTAPATARLAALGALASRGDLPQFAFGTVERGSDRGLVGGTMTLSPSQAEAYDTCPRRYALERRLHVGDSSTVYLLFGSLVHDVLERAERAARDRGDHHATENEALRELDTRFDPADFGGEPWATAWRRRAEEALARLYRGWPRESLPVVDVERPFAIEFGGRAWTGRADRIEGAAGRLRIVDYKTSSSAKSVSEVEESLQLAFYAVATAADSGLGGEVAAAEMWYPAVRAAKSVTIRRLDLGRLDELKGRLVAAADGIAAEVWEATPSDACERCRVRNLCPAWPEGSEAFA
jgi:superfamily I DNA/RNA helicase/CRISPR/Cas system-associated exonuclease Cas4 (RecB family)